MMREGIPGCIIKIHDLVPKIPKSLKCGIFGEIMEMAHLLFLALVEGRVKYGDREHLKRDM